MPSLIELLNLSDYDLARLRAATVTQIRTVVNNRLDELKTRVDGMTKRQLIEFLLEALEYADASPPATTYWPDGQVKSRQAVVQNALGAKIRSTLTEWAYYPPEDGRVQGPVDTITTRERDASDIVVRQRRIKHYTDGRQPETEATP